MQPSLWSLFLIFLRVGAFTFGGGYAMLPLMQEEIVDRAGWFSTEEFADVLGLAQTLPGPVSINVAVLATYRLAGVPGAIVSTLGVALPAFAAVLAVASVFTRIAVLKTVTAAFRGIRPAMVGLLAVAAWRIGAGSLKSRVDVVGTVIAFTLLVVLHVHPIAVILLGGVVGLAAARRKEA